METQNQIIREIGSMGIPKDFPMLKGKIIEIGKDFDGSPLYFLQTGGRYTESELQ
jgi:hypothetical protein